MTTPTPTNKNDVIILDALDAILSKHNDFGGDARSLVDHLAESGPRYGSIAASTAYAVLLLRRTIKEAGGQNVAKTALLFARDEPHGTGWGTQTFGILADIAERLDDDEAAALRAALDQARATGREIEDTALPWE